MISNSFQHTAIRFLQRGVVLLLCLSLGMHWGVLQGIAWTGMLVSNLTGGSVMEAVEKTFDGEHPCPLCLAVKEGREKEKKDDSMPTGSKVAKKLDAVLVAHFAIFAPEGVKVAYAAFLTKNAFHFEEITGPPPRWV